MVHSYEKYLAKHPPFTIFKADDIKKSQVVVVIPVYLEDALYETMESLVSCTSIHENVAVLLVINASMDADDKVIQQQEKTIKEISAFTKEADFIDFYTVEALGLPKKHFGAGLARKIGMDLAIQHFSNINNEKGIVVSLDADSVVQPNYFLEIVKYFKKSRNKACSIYFEHPIEGSIFNEEVYDAITQYELHLRYYIECLRYIGFPYAVHTVGSCLAFKASSYVSVGGMNRRQGGEEFYFIQKLLQQDGYGEINTTTVYPSPRMSSRVPFGTGPTVKKIVENHEEYLTYNLQCFLDLKPLFETIENYYQLTDEKYQEELLNLPGRVRSFLLNSNFYQELKPIGDNCSNIETFKKRFYHVFNAFKLVKYVNYTHEHFLEKTSVFDAAIELFELEQINVDDVFEDKELLQMYRKLQR